MKQRNEAVFYCLNYQNQNTGTSDTSKWTIILTKLNHESKNYSSGED